MSCEAAIVEIYHHVLELNLLRKSGYFCTSNGRNIDCCNYVNALDANLWLGVCKHFAGKHFF